MNIRSIAVIAAVSLTAGACSVRRSNTDGSAAAGSAAGSVALDQQQPNIAPSSRNARQRLDASPRHGEWDVIHTGPSDSVRAWVVYPQRRDNAPVVLVVHEIYGESTWIRAVADQLAADGYIAIAPDLITGKVALQADTVTQQDAVAAVSKLNPADVQRQLTAVAKWGMALPAAQKKYGIVGFCWGGGTSFRHAIESPEGLGASVVYYGPMNDEAIARLSNVKVPVLGLYGGNDRRVDATIPQIDSTMKALGKTYEPHVFDGAGHGFLRAQTDASGAPNAANYNAAGQAWPLTIGWFRKYLGS
jgi:carboxymethylenebutenolidase